MRQLLSLAVVSFAALPTLAQVEGVNPQTADKDASPDFAPPYVALTFSDPKLDSPLQLPSTLTDGPPVCAGNGAAFLQFWTPPPTYDTKEIYSVSAKGEVTKFPLAQINGLSKVDILSFDPGSSEAVMLLNATPSDYSSSFGEPAKSGIYLARFTYDGKIEGYARLELGFHPVGAAQLAEDSFLILGTDGLNALPITVLIDGNGRMLRHLDAEELVPSSDKLQRILRATTFAGMRPEELPPAMRLSTTLSLFHFAHDGSKMLLLEPGPHARIVEFSSNAETRVVSLKLPQGQYADSVLATSGRWIIRAHPESSDSQSNLFEVDPETGETLREIRTAGASATSIACPADKSFYGLRWIHRKPYVITGTY